MKSLIKALKIFFILTILTGVIYPLLVTGICQLAFPARSNGSLISADGKIIGSELIGQQFDSTEYFVSRPSAVNYNPLPSGASNFGLTNAKLRELVDMRRNNFIYTNHLDSSVQVPSDILFASASGLDPHISKEAAFLQVNKIARARNFNDAQKQVLLQLIESQTEKPQLLFLGNERINVLLINMMVDKIK